MPKAKEPAARGKLVVPASAALFVQFMPVNAAPAAVFRSFKTMELGLMPVRVLLIKSLFTDSETSPFGVIRQEQQATNCSSAEKAYRFTQMFPAAFPNPGPFNEAPLLPVFVMLMTESPA